MADILAYNENMNTHDDMEISSEVGQRDMDFEIDFDHIVEEREVGKEEEMQDDTTVVHEQEDIELRSATDNNDYMLDDTAQDDVLVDQDVPVIEDTVQQIADEELLDLSEEDELSLAYQAEDAEGNDTSLAALDEAPTHDVSHNEPTFDLLEGAHEAGDETVLTEEFTESHTIEGDEHQGESISEPTKTVGTDEGGLENGVEANEQQISTTDNIDFTTSGTHSESQDQQDTSQLEADLNHNTEHSPEEVQEQADPAVTRGPEEPATLTGLHPTTVIYDGGIYSLFPSSNPSEDEQYFLEDENLVNGSIGNLLQACRSALADGITDDYELELQVEEFELYISEDSTAAYSTSFAEILDVFVLINRNDGVEPAPALTVQLNVRPKFTNRLTLLANLAAEGKGTAHVPSRYYHEPEYVHEAEQSYTATAEVADKSGEEDGLFDDKQYAETADDEHDGNADDFFNQYTAEKEPSTLEDTATIAEEAPEDSRSDSHGPVTEGNPNEAAGEIPDDSLSALVEESASVVAEDSHGGENASESDTTSKTMENGSPAAEPQSPAPEEEDELDFDDNYDDELAINASVTTSTTGTATKRALDDASTADDQETKRLRSSN